MAIPNFVRINDYPFGIQDADHSNALFLGFDVDSDRPSSLGRRVCTKTVQVNPRHRNFYQMVLCLNTSKGIMAYDVSHGIFNGTWLVRYSISCPTVKEVVVEYKEAIFALPQVPFTKEVKDIVGCYGRSIPTPTLFDGVVATKVGQRLLRNELAYLETKNHETTEEMETIKKHLL